MKLKNIILTEQFQTPSDQILKGAVKEFKRATGINVKDPALDVVKSNNATYTISMIGEIGSPLMQRVFTDMYFRITVVGMRNIIGGYMFDFHLVYKDVNGKVDSVHFGPVMYKDGKYTSRIQ